MVVDGRARRPHVACRSTSPPTCAPQLPKEALQSEVVLAHMGSHVLKEGISPMPVYMALTHPLMLLRTGLLGPVRSVQQVSTGVLQVRGHGALFVHFACV